MKRGTNNVYCFVMISKAEIRYCRMDPRGTLLLFVSVVLLSSQLHPPLIEGATQCQPQTKQHQAQEQLSKPFNA